MKKVIYSLILIALALTSSFSQSFYAQPTRRSSNNMSNGSVIPITNYNNGYQRSNDSRPQNTVLQIGDCKIIYSF